MPDGKYYIIEHPTKGCLTSLDFEYGKWVSHFSWSAPRSHEGIQKFYSVAEADVIMRRLPTRIAERCKILRSTDWKEVVLG